jgi:hypothetical protein
MSCDDDYNYYKKVLKRRSKELRELNALTGWDIASHANYTGEYRKLRDDAYRRLVKEGKITPKKSGFGAIELPEGSNKWGALFIVFAAVGLVWWASKKSKA